MGFSYDIIAKTDKSQGAPEVIRMHLNQIHSFITVSKTLNFTGAARQLGVPQSTISRQINDLETQLGVKLFYRTKRDVQLTDEGKIFLPYAQEIADAARKGSYAVRQLYEGAAGRLAIAAAPAVQPFLIDALSVFHRKYPDIAVDITPVSGGMSLMDDTDAPYDFWFLYRDLLLDPENFDYLHVCRQPLCIVSATDSAALPDSKNPAGGLPDFHMISSEPFILLSEEEDPILYMQVMNYCRTHRFSPKIANTSGDISSVLLSVSAGLGVSILPASLLHGPLAGDVKAGLLGDDSYDLDCIAAWKPSLLNPAARLFLEVLQDMAPSN